MVEYWQELCLALKGERSLPSEVATLLDLPLDEAIKQGGKKGIDRIFTETTTVSESYLDFLKTQIDLQPRGKKWANLMAKRREALRPYVGSKVVTLMVLGPKTDFCVRFDPKEGKIINIENLEVQL